MFIEIFNELLKEHNLNRRQFAEKSGIPYPTVIGWTNLNRLPDFVTLIKIADFFKCSIDFLTGRQDDFGVITCANELNSTEQLLLKNYRELDPENKNIILALTAKLK